MLHIKIGTEIRTQRAFVGVSLLELCKVSKCTTRVFREYENGREMPVGTLALVVDALGLTLTDFFGVVEEYTEQDTETQTLQREMFLLRRENDALQVRNTKLHGENIALGKEAKRLNRLVTRSLLDTRKTDENARLRAEINELKTTVEGVQRRLQRTLVFMEREPNAV